MRKRRVKYEDDMRVVPLKLPYQSMLVPYECLTIKGPMWATFLP